MPNSSAPSWRNVVTAAIPERALLTAAVTSSGATGCPTSVNASDRVSASCTRSGMKYRGMSWTRNMSIAVSKLSIGSGSTCSARA